MAVMTPREAWTDERLNEGFREVRAEIGALRAELGQVRESLGELRAEIKGLEKKFDAKFDAMNRTMQVGFGLTGAMLAGILGLIAAQL
jgi:prefoldin subunit 5